jgi:hypothetical protein
MEFEPADVATVVALSVAINQGTLAFGPAAFGALYDVTGGYLVPFILAALAEFDAPAPDVPTITFNISGPHDHIHPTSVDPPIPDQIAAPRKSTVQCQ